MLRALRRQLPVEAALGEEEANPRYAKPTPLGFAPTSGAPAEASRFRWTRDLALDTGEDLYSVTLAAEDLAALRPDLGDVRIADSGGAGEWRGGLGFVRASRRSS